MPSALPPFAELLAELQRAFARLGVRWFLFGAQAAILYGVARLSADIDVTVELGARSSAELIDALTEEALARRDLLSELERLTRLARGTEPGARS